MTAASIWTRGKRRTAPRAHIHPEHLEMLDTSVIDPDIVTFFTDGSSSRGEGGWAFIGMYGSHTHRDSGYLAHATCNIAELTAIKKALGSLEDPALPVLIITDSIYAKNALTLWPAVWARTDWKNSVGADVANAAIIREVLALKEKQVGGVTFQWMKGHVKGMSAFIEFNRQADEAASRARRYGKTNEKH